MCSASNYREFAYWLKQAFLAQLEEHIDRENGQTHPSGIGALIKAVQQAVNPPLKNVGWRDIRYHIGMEQVVAYHESQGLIPVAQLSDGVRNILSLAADIAFRCCRLNPHLGELAPQKTRGVVLIDELDMHLHPRWQHTVIDAFRQAFPVLQLILTTHSPHLTSTVPSKCLRILEDSQVFAAPTGTKGAEASRILKRVFGTEERAPDDENTQKLARYLDLVHRDQWQEASALRDELDAIFQGEEPKLFKADQYMENRKWELEIEADSEA